MNEAIISTMLLMFMVLTGLAIDLEYHAPQPSYATLPREVTFGPFASPAPTFTSVTSSENAILIVSYYADSHGETFVRTFSDGEVTHTETIH